MNSEHAAMHSRELISKKTRTEFREFLVSCTLREIADEFESAGLRPDTTYAPQVSGQRRTLVEQYYNKLDFTNNEDVDRLLHVYENILTQAAIQLKSPEAFSGDVAKYKAALSSMLAWLQKDGYEFANGKLVPTGRSAYFNRLSATAQNIDAEYLETQIQRLQRAVADDPALAIGQAKELIETCCKTILSERGVCDVDKLEVSPLVRKTAEELKLVPDGVSDSARGAKSIKAVLGNLATIAQGLAELRNLYGTGHGKTAQTKGLSPRHARLAVGAAAALVTFLFDTHAERSAAKHVPPA